MKRLFLLCGAFVLYAGAQAAEYLSPIAIVASRDAKRLYVAEATAKQIATVELASGKPAAAWRLPQEPSGLALAPNGTQLLSPQAVRMEKFT